MLDTSVLIDLLRGHPRAEHYLVGLDERPSCSEITRVEVIRGLRSGERRDAEQLFAETRWVAIDEEVARVAGELGRRWSRSHPGISTPDLVIAATTERVGAELATANVRLFPMFRGSRPPYTP